MNTEASLISVIVPIYNIENYLHRCIDSIINQDYKNLEIILVDDGSTDRSGEICDSFSEIDKRIVVIHKKNGGLVSARKSGLEVASGQYVGFVDGDDYIEPSFYTELLNLLIGNDFDFVHTSFVYDNFGRREVYYQDELTLVNIDNDERERLIEEYVVCSNDYRAFSPSIWSKLFKRDFIKECYFNIPDYLSQGEDLLNLAYILLNANSFLLKNLTLYNYCRREGSYTEQFGIENIEENLRQYRELKRIFIKNDLYDRFKMKLEEKYTKVLVSKLSRLETLKEGIFAYPFEELNKIIGKKVIIYGAGKCGVDYYTQIKRCNECEVVLWVDSNYMSINKAYCKVESPDMIHHYEFDYIVIAICNETIKRTVSKMLIENGVEGSKII